MNITAALAELGLPSGVSIHDAKVCYRKLALLHHPDLNPTDTSGECERKMAMINEAYEIVTDSIRSGGVCVDDMLFSSFEFVTPDSDEDNTSPEFDIGPYVWLFRKIGDYCHEDRHGLALACYEKLFFELMRIHRASPAVSSVMHSCLRDCTSLILELGFYERAFTLMKIAVQNPTRGGGAGKTGSAPRDLPMRLHQSDPGPAQPCQYSSGVSPARFRPLPSPRASPVRLAPGHRCALSIHDDPVEDDPYSRSYAVFQAIRATATTPAAVRAWQKTFLGSFLFEDYRVNWAMLKCYAWTDTIEQALRLVEDELIIPEMSIRISFKTKSLNHSKGPWPTRTIIPQNQQVTPHQGGKPFIIEGGPTPGEIGEYSLDYIGDIRLFLVAALLKSNLSLEDPSVVATYPRVSRIIGRSIPWATLVKMATKKMRYLKSGVSYCAIKHINKPDMKYTEAEVNAIWKRAFKMNGKVVSPDVVDMKTRQISAGRPSRTARWGRPPSM